jgi:retinol dehydrogenase-12
MAKFSWLRLIRRQYTAAQPVLRADLTGQTVVVTGSNVGLGLETAKHFARMGPKRLVLACRNKAKGEAALARESHARGRFASSDSLGVSELKKETGFEAAELMILDMSTFASVQTFVDAFEAAHERLDILVLNAAVAMLSYEASADGWEST